MGEGELQSIGWQFGNRKNFRATRFAVPSPVGRERVRVREISMPVAMPVLATATAPTAVARRYITADGVGRSEHGEFLEQFF